MSRNRRHQSRAIRLVPALKAVLLVTLLGGTGAGYVLQKNKIHELGREIEKREAHLRRLQYENKLRATHLADLQLPHKLAERAREQRLGLTPVQPTQMVWLTEPPPTPGTNAPAALLVLGQ